MAKFLNTSTTSFYLKELIKNAKDIPASYADKNIYVINFY